MTESTTKISGIPADFVFADVEPMIIEVAGKTWYHPFIETWFQPEDSGVEPGHDCGVYHLEFTNGQNETLVVYFKSRYLDQKCDEFFDRGEEFYMKAKNDLFKPPFIDCDLLYEHATLTLLEDCYVPMPRPGVKVEDIKNVGRYVEWINSGIDSGQFCFSDFGSLVNEFFDEETRVTWFTPDCGMTTEPGENFGIQWWCDS